MKTLGLSLLVITTSMSIFLGVGWRKASAIVQTTSTRLDQIESEYAVETREDLYDIVLEINTDKGELEEKRMIKRDICNKLFDSGVSLTENDLLVCGTPLSITE